MPNVVITGAGRGIGLEFVKQYQAEGWKVFATCRDSKAAESIKGVGKHVEVFSLEVSNVESIQKFARELGEQSVDVLIANAGVMGGDIKLDSDSVKKWHEVFAINTMGPYLLALALSEHVRRSEQKKMIAVTSRMGSIDDNTSGGHVPYRTSKAALNMAWKSLSIGVQSAGIMTAVLHPGWVKTDMGGAGATLSREESVRGMRQVIADLTPAGSGSFFDYKGGKILW